MDDKIKKTLQSSKSINAVRRAPVIEKAIKYTGEALKQVENAEAQQVANNPYFEHIPKDNAANATIYAAKMGGEHHENSECIIL